MNLPTRLQSPRARRLAGVALATLLAPGSMARADGGSPGSFSDPEWDGDAIMRQVLVRHESFPYVYEEQTMVLMDATGNRTVRQCRRFTRVEADGTVKFLLVFDHPREIRGVALLARRDADGTRHQGVYLPAFGRELKRPTGSGRNGHFLGTDFAVEDLTADDPADFNYLRVEDRVVDEVAYFVVEAYPASVAVERRTGYGLRRHFVRKDNFVVAQTDYYDRRLRFMKRLTRHDLKRVNGESWRANMIVVDDDREQHRTLLKVDRRIYSRDYVPASIFEPGFLLDNGHLRILDAQVAGRPAPARRSGNGS